MILLQKLSRVGDGGIFDLFVAFTDEHVDVDLQRHPEDQIIVQPLAFLLDGYHKKYPDFSLKNIKN